MSLITRLSIRRWASIRTEEPQDIFLLRVPAYVTLAHSDLAGRFHALVYSLATNVPMNVARNGL